MKQSHKSKYYTKMQYITYSFCRVIPLTSLVSSIMKKAATSLMKQLPISINL